MPKFLEPIFFKISFFLISAKFVLFSIITKSFPNCAFNKLNIFHILNSAINGT